MSLGGGEWVSDTEPGPLQGLERHLERLAAIQVHEHTQPTGAERLEARDEGVRHGEKVKAKCPSVGGWTDRRNG